MISIILSIFLAFSFVFTMPVSSDFIATAYTLRVKKTANGSHVRRGIIAAHSKVFKLGTKVYLEFKELPKYNGIYSVEDRGYLKKNVIDVWVGGVKEARLFGKRRVAIKVLK